MRNVWILLKNYFLCAIGSMRSKKSRTKTVIGVSTVVVLYAVLFAAILGFMLFLAQSITQPMPTEPGIEPIDTSELINSVLAMGLIISVFMTFVFALQKVTGGKKSNDTELLLSMPFKKAEIMAAKFLWSFAFNLAITILFFLPCVIAYLAYTPFNLIAMTGCFVVLLIIPLFAVGLSSIVDYLVTVCFLNTKFGNISKAIFTLVTLIAVMVVYEFFALNLEDPVVMKYAVNWIITFNPKIMIPLISGVILLFVLGCWLNSLLLKRESRTTQFKTTQINHRVTTPLKSLLKNETNRYFNSPALMINTLIGPLAIVAITGWMLFDKGKTFLPLIQAFGFSDSVIYLFIGLAFALFAVLTYPAAISISIEGKQFWILRSMPISAATVLTAKALFNIILLVPLTLACGIVLQIALKISTLNFIIMMTIPTLTTVLVSYLGIMLNLWFPKFEFESENALIKQSVSGMIMMFAGMLIIGALCGLSIWLLLNIAFEFVAIIIILILALITGIAIILTYTLGQRIFNCL